MKEYLYIEELASRTPWTAKAIRTRIARGKFRLGEHYFKPDGPNGRPIFSWRAVVALIEGKTRAAEATGATIPLASGAVVKLDEAAAALSRLHD